MWLYENILDQWSDLMQQSYLQLRHFFDNSAIPTVMEHYGVAKEKQIVEVLKWQYPDRAREGDTNALLVKLLEVRSIIPRSVPLWLIQFLFYSLLASDFGL
jgi:hypothetical protein